MKDYPLDADARAMIAEQERIYRETDGREGGSVEVPGRPPAPVLLLTTKGRKSGEPRTTPLIYGTDGSDFLIVASLGGYDRPPQWFLNLGADPAAELQVMSDRFPVNARTASAEEKPRLWEIVTEIYPTYAEYQTMTEREIPVVILTPTG